MSVDLWDKLEKFATSLGPIDYATLSAAAVGGLVPAATLFRSWAHSTGREYEVLHGQVPQLKREQENLRFQILALLQQIEATKNQARIFEEDREVARSDPTDLPADIQDVLRVRSELVKPNADVWGLRAAQPLVRLRERLSASGMRIITIGNLKGGVGKTTVTANLAAYFAQSAATRGKRVLAIDLDYQGSLSATLLQAAKRRIDHSAAEYILGGEATGEWLSRVTKELEPSLAGVDLIPAGYTLAAAEDLLMMRWLYHTIHTDVRFNLAEFLLSEQVQDKYKIVLIDVGPRLTTASISALCASTHLVIPTNLDQLSTETIGSFLNRVRSLKQSLNLPIELAGVLGTMTYRDVLTDAENDAIGTIRDGISQWGSDTHIFKRTIPRKQVLANVAGSDIGYRVNSEIRTIFNTLGLELESRIKL